MESEFKYKYFNGFNNAVIRRVDIARFIPDELKK